MIEIVNIIFVVLFWNMSTVATNEERPGWSLIYLFASAANGAAVFAAHF